MLRMGRTQTLVKNVQNIGVKMNEKAASIVARIEEKVKGTFMENWVKYWKTVSQDYRDVALDVHKDMKEKPLKALMLFTGFCGVYYCAKHNPAEIDFRDAYLKAANEVLLVHPSSQRKETIQHLRHIETCYNNQVLRRLNCGVASIIWIDNFSDRCNTSEAQCSYLQVEYSKLRSRILDVGFLDNWWVLSNKMNDYDINY